MPLNTAIDDLEAKASTGEVSLGVLMDGFEQLESSTDRRAYFTAYTKVVARSVQEAIDMGRNETAAVAVRSGKPIQEVAKALAVDQFGYLLSKYSSSEFHKEWYEAVPELCPEGRLQNLLGF